MNWADYQFAVPPCFGAPQPGTSALAAAILDAWPSAGSDGIYACRKIADGDTPSVHSEGRAFDCRLALVDGLPNPIGDEIRTTLGENAVDLRIQLIIWNRRIYSAAHPWPEGDVYSVPGGDPHTTHLHIEQNWSGALNLTFDTATDILSGAAHSRLEHDLTEDDMTTLVRDTTTGCVYGLSLDTVRHVTNPTALAVLTKFLSPPDPVAITNLEIQGLCESVALAGRLRPCKCGQPGCEVAALNAWIAANNPW